MTKTCPYCAEEIKAEAIRCRYCHAWLSRPPAGSQPSTLGAWWADVGPGKVGMLPLRRPREGRMVAGVCAAFARSLRVDPTLLRVVAVIATVFTAFVPGILIYILLAVVIPPEEGVGPEGF